VGGGGWVGRYHYPLTSTLDLHTVSGGRLCIKNAIKCFLHPHARPPPPKKKMGLPLPLKIEPTHTYGRAESD
jgi:hypothetical protein